MKDTEINFNNIIFVPSRSKLSMLIESAGSRQAAYDSMADKERWEHRVAEHDALTASTKLLSKFMPSHQRTQLGSLHEAVQEDALIVILGGDDYYTLCAGAILEAAQESRKNIVIVGVNGKPAYSHGALLPFTPPTFLEALNKPESLRAQATPYLEAIVTDGHGTSRAFPSVSQVFVGEYVRADTSSCRVVLPDGDDTLPKKGSGILFALDVGSKKGSWYNNAGGIDIPSGAYGVLVTENANADRCRIVKSGITTVHSSFDSLGCVEPDSHKERYIEVLYGGRVAIERKISPVRTLYPVNGV